MDVRAAAQRHHRLLLRQLLVGELSGDQRMSASAMMNLDLHQEYVVCFFQSEDDPATTATALALRPHVTTLVAEPGTQRVIGLGHKTPPSSIKFSIGVSLSRPLDRLRMSLAEAEQASQVAVALGIRRCVTADEVPLLSAILFLPTIGAELVDRCFGHVTGEHRAATVRTIDAYLNADTNADQAAGALFVHPNTVRYRLRRLTEATGLNPARTQDALMLWWAVRYFQAAHARLGSDGAFPVADSESHGDYGVDLSS